MENTISIGAEERIAAPEASARCAKAAQDDVKRDWGNKGCETAVRALLYVFAVSNALMAKVTERSRQLCCSRALAAGAAKTNKHYSQEMFSLWKTSQHSDARLSRENQGQTCLRTIPIWHLERRFRSIEQSILSSKTILSLSKNHNLRRLTE
ncbi:hypothetical protein [Enterovibrio norvegicus]|uniref:hypothetical protein n=1 Tax=Enterovibrio norvegicus TaxID=188144 RepID=UPI0013D4302F|nr:hypothetical protein [Enterovibrio norvegicus]